MLELNIILEDFLILKIILTFSSKGTGPMKASCTILLKDPKQKPKETGRFTLCVMGDFIIIKERKRERSRDKERDLHT